MKLLQCRLNDSKIVGVKINDKCFNLTRILLDDVARTLPEYEAKNLTVLVRRGILDSDMFDKIEEIIAAGAASEHFIDECNVEILPPVKPSKIIALGRNYAAHAAEGGAPVPDEPILFPKLPSSVTAHLKDVIIPHWLDTRVDHEVELAVIMGRRAKYVTEENAYDSVFGYTILNDVTARSMQKTDMKSAHPWMRSKSLDTFCPLGPYVVPHRYIGDPQSLELSIKVNDEIRQSSNTSKMVFSIQKLVEYISKHFTLLPGDVIATGTPEGISEINNGDVMRAEIENIGVLENRVVREES